LLLRHSAGQDTAKHLIPHWAKGLRMNGVLTPLSHNFSLVLRLTDAAQGDLKFAPLLSAL